MAEFIFDGRKADRVENEIDPMTKVTEVYVEPKQEKKLAKRITERLCVCEREIETINESTGEVVDRVVERVCEGSTTREKSVENPLYAMVEKRVSEGKVKNYIFIAVIVAQVLALAYVLFAM